MGWNMISAISTAVMAFVILLTAPFAIRQLKEASRSRKLAAFANLGQFLQREEIRKARGALIHICKDNFQKWTTEEREEAEKACAAYDLTGIMASQKLIDRDLVAREWRNSIIKCWEQPNQ